MLERVERITVRAQVNDTDLYFESVGVGTPMLLMHGGLGLDHTYFRPFLDPLAESVELIFYDHRGHGRSAALETWGDVDHAMLVDDADALRERLGHEEIVVFGHSYGGFLAQEYALSHGDRLAGLVLCSTAPALDYVGEIREMVANAGVAAPEEQLATAELVFSGAGAQSDADFRREWCTILPLYFAAPDADVLARLDASTTYRAAAWTRAATDLLPAFNVADRLHEVDVPTLVIGGRHDWITPPAQADRLSSLLPRSEVVILDRSGHFPFIEERDRFVTAVRDWLDRLPGA